MLEELRNRGNFVHNQRVISKGCGTLKVRQHTKSKNSNYEYCIHCKALYSHRDLWRHMKICKMKPENEVAEGKQKVLGIASALKFAIDHTFDHGPLKMLSRMHDNSIASVVRNDFYLMRYAESLYRKHGHDSSKHEYIRQKIRQIGRFLLEFRETSQFLNLEDAVKPNNFLKVIEAVKNPAGYSSEKNSYKVPSLMLKIGHSLVKINEIIHCHALITNNEAQVKSSDAFEKLHRKKWAEYISHSALSTISEMKYNKPTKLPLREDVAKLHKHLDKITEAAVTTLKEAATAQNYSSLAKAVLTKIILFNRRRVGEVSKMKLKNFMERDCTKSNEITGLSE